MDAITLDQLRTLIAVVDEGSFSAAGRKLQRVQSAVSHAMANLEAQLGVVLWDRTSKLPVLTPQGKLLLGNARRICADVDDLKQVAAGLVRGLEPSLSLAVDALLPLRAVVDLCRQFAREFPSVELRLHTETLSAVAALVLDGSCELGVVGPAALTPGLERVHLASVRMVTVVAKQHPLAARRARISSRVLAEHTHIVFSERGGGPRTPDQAVLSPNTWRVADLTTKRALLLAGLGWGNLPQHMIEADLERGTLVAIQPAAWGQEQWNLALSVVHRPGLTHGPATKWVLERLPALCVREPGVTRRPAQRAQKRQG